MNKQEVLNKYWQKQSNNFTNQYKKEKTIFFQNFVYIFLNKRYRIISDMIADKINRESVIADIGCGSGVYVELCASFSPKKIIGVDYSQEMINQVNLRQNNYNKEGLIDIKLMTESADNLSLEDESCDIVLAIGLFDYLDYPERALAEICRVLKNGGQAIITLPNKYSPLFFLRYWPGLYLRQYLLKLPPIVNWWSKKESFDLFNDFNFTVVDIKIVQGTMWIFNLRK